jgi:hypothetical protein
MAMATLTLMFPDDRGIELSISFVEDERLLAGIELQQICLSGETTDFGEWLSESAIAFIEHKIKREIDSAYLCSIAVDYENAA